MKKIVLFLFVATLTFIFANDKFNSAYSSIKIKDCITISSDKMGGSFKCKNYHNIGVEVLEGDLRQSITLIRNKKRYPLDMWSSVSPAFSSLGDKIEWRFKQNNSNHPTAMISRYTTETGERSEKSTSYLVITKITDTKMCVVGKIKPQKNQNILARNMADKAHKMKCVLEQKVKPKRLAFIKDEALQRVMDKNFENFNYIQNMGPIEQSIRLMELPSYSKWHLRLQLYPIFSKPRQLSGYKVVFERLNLSGSSTKNIPADRHELFFDSVMNNPALFSKEKSHFKTLSTSYKSTKNDGDWGESKRVMLKNSPWESKINTLPALVRTLAKEAGWLRKNGVSYTWSPQEIPEGMNNSTPWVEIIIDNHLGIEGSYTAQWHDLVSDDSIAKTLYSIYVNDDETNYALMNKAVVCGRGKNTTQPIQICQ